MSRRKLRGIMRLPASLLMYEMSLLLQIYIAALRWMDSMSSRLILVMGAHAGEEYSRCSLTKERYSKRFASIGAR